MSSFHRVSHMSVYSKRAFIFIILVIYKHRFSLHSACLKTKYVDDIYLYQISSYNNEAQCFL